MLRPARETRRNRYVGLLVCILASMALGVWHNRVTARGRGDFVTSAVRTVTVPVVHAFGSTGAWVSRQTGWLFRGRTLDRENRRLREEIARLREDNARLTEADITAERLRQQLGFHAGPPAVKLAADIVSLRPHPSFETMVIGRGSRDGVRAGSVVVSPDGLVGQVYDSAPTSAAVLLLTDSSAAAGARVQRSRAVGVCKGDGTDQLSLVYLDREADVKMGDRVITSGLGGSQGIFPKGLVIGTVTTVTRDVSGSTRVVHVRPAVNIGRLEEVYVIP